MKIKITFLFGFFLMSNVLLAQFTAEDIRYWIGEGDKECYFVLDFRDGTTDPSFAFGFRFDEGEDVAFVDILEKLSLEEPVFSYEMTGMFLDDVIYNSHSGLSGEPDWWSTWSGEAVDEMSMNGGMSESLTENRWYGLSYGFMPAPQMPTVTYPAYSSQWFLADEFEYALGEGDDYAVVVIDFVEENGEDPVSFAWKVQFDEVITFKDALLLIDSLDSEFEVEFDGENLVALRYKNLEGTEWLVYEGTNMSDWRLAETDVLMDGSWLGLAKGEQYTRRPFTPVPAEENPVMNIENFDAGNFVVFPNPVSDVLYIKGNKSVEIKIYDVSGREVRSIQNVVSGEVDFSEFQNGIYLIKLSDEKHSKTLKVLKK